MSGICGYVGDHRPELLEAMGAAVAHRGPDGSGSHADADQAFGLGHRRLAVIDPGDAGRQPMSNPDGTLWIAFDGCIYDFPEHRQRLEAKGHRFRGRTDTEVLLHLYDERGEDFLADVNGVFAIAIWDARRRRLLLARDHAGIRPLYYWQDGRRLFFASEIKALTRIPEMPREIDPAALPVYLRFSWIPGAETMLAGVRKVEPGHYVVWEDGHLESRCWFSLDWRPDPTPTLEEWGLRARQVLLDAVRRQMAGDVPVGSYLSGGMDTSSIVACMRQLQPDREIRVYTAAPDADGMAREGFGDDYFYARQVAEHLGLELRSFEFEPAYVKLLPRIVYHMDEPDADPAILASYQVTRLAHEDGLKVLLSGAGGDESFFGNRTHRAYRLYQQLDWIPPWLSGPVFGAAGALLAGVLGAQSPLPRRVAKFRRALATRGLARHLEIVDWSNPTTREGLLTPETRARLGDLEAPPSCMRRYDDAFFGEGENNRHTWLLMLTFLGAHDLVYNDKSGMANSVAVRVPFMDRDLLRFVASIPEHHKLHRGIRKYVLKIAMEDLLPKGLFERKKAPFGAPLRQWMMRDLDAVIGELLGPARVGARGLFEPRAVEAILEANRANKADHAYLIYALLTLELWQQTFIDRAGEEVTL